MSISHIKDKNESHYTWRFTANVFIRGSILFMLINYLFPIFITQEALGKLSLYNLVFTGRERLPFGENPQQSYNVSLYNLDAMFASHSLTGGIKPQNEIRVIVLGDSSVWGILLKPEETLSGFLNAQNIQSGENKHIRFYNLGYPTLSLTKDLMILEEANKYQPDLIIWLITLESFPEEKQLSSPLVENNSGRVSSIIDQYHLPLQKSHAERDEFDCWSNTIIGQRRMLADILRLQYYGVLWSATGIDQVYPQSYEPAQRDFERDISFHDWEPPLIIKDQLRFDYLTVAREMTGYLPMLLVNEPILISNGINSDLRYNFYYPRWAYDQYRGMLRSFSQNSGLEYLDLWDIIPEHEFTNSAIHLTPSGSLELANRIGIEIERIVRKVN